MARLEWLARDARLRGGDKDRGAAFDSRQRVGERRGVRGFCKQGGATSFTAGDESFGERQPRAGAEHWGSDLIGDVDRVRQRPPTELVIADRPCRDRPRRTRRAGCHSRSPACCCCGSERPPSDGCRRRGNSAPRSADSPEPERTFLQCHPIGGLAPDLLAVYVSPSIDGSS